MFKALSKDYLRGLILSAVSVIVVIPIFCVFVVVPLWYVSNNPNASMWALIVPLALFLLVMLGLPALGGGVVLYRRKRWLDDLLAPLGLQGKLYALSGREYRGMVEGREVIARFMRGPTFELYVQVPARTRATFSWATAVIGPLARMVKYQPLLFDEPELAGLSITGLDEGWLRALLAAPDVRAAAARLMQAANSWALLQQIIISPAAVQLRLYRNKNLWRYEISPEEARQWLADLLLLAGVIERLPEPQSPIAESSLEEVAREGRLNKLMLPVLLATLIGIPLCGILITVVILALD